MTSKTDGTTHAEGCHGWGPRHYDCALREIERLKRERDEDVGRMERAAEAVEKLNAECNSLERELAGARADLERAIANHSADLEHYFARASVEPADQPEGER